LLIIFVSELVERAARHVGNGAAAAPRNTSATRIAHHVATIGGGIAQRLPTGSRHDGHPTKTNYIE
jgi:hypothetical protein